MIIHCCKCNDDIDARLTDGAEIYPHRKDLSKLPFWKCDTCGNYVGCHHKTNGRTKPLGCIPTPELRAMRGHIHRIIDPLWRDLEGVSRKQVYSRISDKLGYRFHSANISTIEEAEKALLAAKVIETQIIND